MDRGSFNLLHTLVTGRDGSYAGLQWNPKDPNELIVSFYSDHERIKGWRRFINNPSNDIWVARLIIS